MKQQQNVQYFNSMARGWREQNLDSFKPELPQLAEWDQLLGKLGLNDSQALDAVKSNEDAGQQLRRFVSRVFRHNFVPEVVLEAVRSRGQLIVSEIDQSTAAN